MYKMDKTYKETLVAIETQLIFFRNHLGNIDSHLERLNNSIGKHGEALATNKTSIMWLWRIIGLFTVGLIGLVIKLIIEGG